MLHPRVIRDLARYPMWIIDDITVNADGSVEARGWSLPDDADLTTGTITMNDALPISFARQQSPNLGRAFPWHDNAEYAAFHAIWAKPEDDGSDVLRFSYVARWTRNPYNRWQDIWFPARTWREKAYVAPGAPHMIRTQGNAQPFWYVTYGTTIAKVMDQVTQTYFGKSLDDYSDICDWGCGCGRVIQGVHRLAPRPTKTGIDIDRDNIDWCRNSLPFGRFSAIPLFPPTSFADGEFDLAYGISVFTHLTRAAFEAWRDELYRIVRPGGAVLVTVSCGANLISVGDEAVIERTLQNEFDDSREDDSLGDHIEDKTYYRGTFLSMREARRIFGVRFRVRDIIPQAAGSGQDFVVCERL
jgi:SAM-dependent methyltransferase